MHDQVSHRVGRRRADQAHVNGEGVVEQPRAPRQFDPFHKALGRPLVQPPTLPFRINEGSQPDVRDTARTPCGNVAEQLANDALRKDIALNEPLRSQSSECSDRWQNAG